MFIGLVEQKMGTSTLINTSLVAKNTDIHESHTKNLGMGRQLEKQATINRHCYDTKIANDLKSIKLSQKKQYIPSKTGCFDTEKDPDTVKAISPVFRKYKNKQVINLSPIIEES